MVKAFVCDWCSERFRTESRLDWHVENVHFKEHDLLVSLDPEWIGVSRLIVEKPGRYLFVIGNWFQAGEWDGGDGTGLDDDRPIAVKTLKGVLGLGGRSAGEGKG